VDLLTIETDEFGLAGAAGRPADAKKKDGRFPRENAKGKAPAKGSDRHG
jgi:hypothetical protein